MTVTGTFVLVVVCLVAAGNFYALAMIFNALVKNLIKTGEMHAQNAALLGQLLEVGKEIRDRPRE